MSVQVSDLDDFLTRSIGAAGTSLVPLLQTIQQQYNYLPEDVLRALSRKTGIAIIEIYRTATFYNSFSLVPRGHHQVVICSGTACHVDGATAISQEISGYLGIQPGEVTDDQEFSLDTVNCLGCCAFAPVMVVDGHYHGHLKAGEATKILSSLRKVDTTVAAEA